LGEKEKEVLKGNVKGNSVFGVIPDEFIVTTNNSKGY
jgi:hypothetical protein